MNAREEDINNDRRILELLSNTYPNIGSVSTRIITLKAILNLPKETEHFMADIHGEHEAFIHILKNGSGNIKRKVKEIFSTQLRESEIRQLCSLIYYPEQKLEMIKSTESDIDGFYSITLHRLVTVCRIMTSKYTRGRVRKSLPDEHSYIIEELLHESSEEENKQAYFNGIIESIVETGQASNIIISLCNVIQRLSVAHLHILGDIFDRGPGAHIILDKLCNHQSFDIQWGNHDANWMGAAAGNKCSIANVLRLTLRFGNLATLEDGYGINLLPLATFAMDHYSDDPCEFFQPGLDINGKHHDEKTRRLIAMMHKAITVIQFKLEAQMIDSHPEWNMNDRKLIERIDFTKGTINIDGKDYKLRDTNFPTIDPSAPKQLTEEEEELILKLQHSFRISEKLQRHIKCLFSHGCMYGIYNSNLLFHASVPLNEDGSLRHVNIMGKQYAGRDLLHKIGMVMRSAFNTDTPAEEKKYARDYFWYLWCGSESPLFDKDRITTFERYFVADESTYAEKKGAYFRLRDNPDVCDKILDAFEVKGEHRHIINGHVPVHVSSGETPIKAGGKLMVIDGGFSRSYHDTTGIAGYTLVFHSRGFQLIQHEPFTTASEAINKGTDIVSSTQIVEMSHHRMMLRDTDKGRNLQRQIKELEELLYAYRHGIIKERLVV